jgi:deoxyribonuclease-4
MFVRSYYRKFRGGQGGVEGDEKKGDLKRAWSEQIVRRIGVHTSIAGGLHYSLERAKELGCNTLQIFSHNPRGWAIKSISEEEVIKFKSLRSHLNMAPLYIHASYLINIASRNRDLRRRSIYLLAIEMDRADAIGAEYVILHPGSASGDDEGVARKRAVDALKEVAMMSRWKAGLLIENTAGEKGDISSRMVDLSDLLNAMKGSLVAGVCIDTCHAFAAGYDLGSEEGMREISEETEKYIGPDKVKLVHLNDSKGDLRSGVDRHEHIGRGKIGEQGLRQFLNHVHFRRIPLILETPKKRETDDYENLKKVRQMIRK